MSKKKSYIDSVEVKNPCTEDWEKMHGNDRVRFCSHCAKDVKNLSSVTRKEAVRMVRAAGGNLCIRYIQHPVTSRPVFADQLFQLTRRAPGLAAGVMTASVALSTQTFAQGGTRAESPATRTVVEEPVDRDDRKQTEPAKLGRLSGTITDPMGAVIPGTKVTIISVDAGKTMSTTSNDEGVYVFDGLEPGDYQAEFEGPPGFAKKVMQGIKISGPKSEVSDTALDVGSFEITVDVVADVNMQVGTVGGLMISVQYSTPLAKAVADDEVELARELIIKGANVNGKEDDYDGITPLFIAVENGNIEMVQLLLDHGARTNVKDGEKQTPLMRLDEDATPELVDLLLRYGSKIDRADKARNTALILAAGRVTPEVLQSLIAAGPDVNAANKEGQTALLNAAYSDKIDNVRLLLEAGADPNARNKDGDTAWDLTSDEEIEQLLVSYGVKVTGKKLEHTVEERPTQ